MNFRRSQFQSVVDTVDGAASSVFELGCGDGEYLDIFRELGLETAGIEGSVTLSQRGRDKGSRRDHRLPDGDRHAIRLVGAV